MAVALAAVALVFAALLVARLLGARRDAWLARWPALVFAVAAAVALLRGAAPLGLTLAGIALLVWFWDPRWLQRAPVEAAPDDAEDQRARALLGLGRNATAAEIRAAYRAKMRSAHPDRGGSHAEAARLAAARDRLLKRLR